MGQRCIAEDFAFIADTLAAENDVCYGVKSYFSFYDVNVTELTENVAADIGIARDWTPGTLKDDGKRGSSEKGFRK